MKFLIVLFCLIAVNFAQNDEKVCYRSEFDDSCKSFEKESVAEACNAKFGGLFNKNDLTINHLYKFVDMQIETSFEYLVMSAGFNNYKLNRAGFEKKFRDLSDDSWEEAIDMIKYLTKRGINVDLKDAHAELKSKVLSRGLQNRKPTNVEVTERGSLASAVDMQKKIVKKAHSIHSLVSDQTLKVDAPSGTVSLLPNAAGKKLANYDPDVATYLEKNILHKYSDLIRTWSGYTNDLNYLMQHHHHAPLAIFMFDEYLQNA